MQQRFALIGCGKIANRHAENIIKSAELAAVCDINQDKADALAGTYNCNSYYTLESLLEAGLNLTVAVICTPNGLHALHSIQCLRHGLHVLCEKPLCLTTVEGEAMIAAAAAADKMLFVVKQNRFNPPVIALKNACTDNALGKISSFQINCFWNRPEKYYQNTWKGSAKLDGGTLFTQFSHFIDLLYWMLGDVKKVQAVARNFDHPYIEIEDAGVVIFEMASGAIGTMNYTVNSYKTNMEGSFTVFGEKGTVKIGGQYLNTLEYQEIGNYRIPPLAQAAGANNYGFYQGSMSNHDKVYQNLEAALSNNSNDMTSPSDGLETVKIIEKIYASLW